MLFFRILHQFSIVSALSLIHSMYVMCDPSLPAAVGVVVSTIFTVGWCCEFKKQFYFNYILFILSSLFAFFYVCVYTLVELLILFVFVTSLLRFENIQKACSSVRHHTKRVIYSSVFFFANSRNGKITPAQEYIKLSKKMNTK